MDATERLTAYLCSRPGSEGQDEFHSELADRMLRQHAHELAQKIRVSDISDCCDECKAAASHAANLIDPASGEG